MLELKIVFAYRHPISSVITMVGGVTSFSAGSASHYNLDPMGLSAKWFLVGLDISL